MRKTRIVDDADVSFTDVANAEGLADLFAPIPHTIPTPSVRRTKLVSDEEWKPPTPKDGTLIPKRRWYCANRQTCKGRAEFTGWDQLLDRPMCPQCQGDMIWVQWLVMQ